jgi:hypothetical protein
LGINHVEPQDRGPIDDRDRKEAARWALGVAAYVLCAVRPQISAQIPHLLYFLSLYLIRLVLGWSLC